MMYRPIPTPPLFLRFIYMYLYIIYYQNRWGENYYFNKAMAPLHLRIGHRTHYSVDDPTPQALLPFRKC